MAATAALARKRKSEAAPRMDEAERTLYSAFCGAANSLSHLHTQSVALQKHAFRAGELHALEKLSQWMLRKHAEGSRLTVADIIAHIQGSCSAALAETAAAALARKRKSEAAPGMDEAERTLYSAFCGAANSLSHLHTQSVALQKHAFRAGELHALEKLSQWMLRKHAEGSRLTVADFIAHIQHEIDYGGSDARGAPRAQTAGQFANTSYQPSGAPYGTAMDMVSDGTVTNEYH